MTSAKSKAGDREDSAVIVHQVTLWRILYDDKLQNSAASAFAFSQVNEVGVYGRIESSRVRFNQTKTAIATSSCKSNIFRIWCAQIKSRCTKRYTKQDQASCSCKSLCSLFVFTLERRHRRKRGRWTLGKTKQW